MEIEERKADTDDAQAAMAPPLEHLAMMKKQNSTFNVTATFRSVSSNASFASHSSQSLQGSEDSDMGYAVPSSMNFKNAHGHHIG